MSESMTAEALAGREMDAEIARVLGGREARTYVELRDAQMKGELVYAVAGRWTDRPAFGNAGPTGAWCDGRVFAPSTSDGDAFSALDDFAGACLYVVDNGWREQDGQRIDGHTCRIALHTGDLSVTAKTRPLAICRCILAHDAAKSDATGRAGGGA